MPVTTTDNVPLRLVNVQLNFNVVVHPRLFYVNYYPKMADRTSRIRKTFVMKLVDESVIPEYVKRHDEIWPDMSAMLKAHGVHNYNIALLQSTLQLFAYVEVCSAVGAADITCEALICSMTPGAQ